MNGIHYKKSPKRFDWEGNEVTRIELYHTRTRPKHFSWKGPLIIVLMSMILSGGIYIFQHFSHNTIKIESPDEDSGRKVVVHLPNGQEVFTYEKYIVKKDGKTYYKGERNKIDLTGGTVDYKNW